jgi:hypothetical protein
VSNQEVAGVGAMGVDEPKPYLQTHWQRIKEELLAGSYHLQLVRQVEIPKPGVRGNTLAWCSHGCRQADRAGSASRFEPSI